MDLEKLLNNIKSLMNGCGASYGLIGALGMSVHGYQRATNDVDLLVDGDDRAEVEKTFIANGYSIFHTSNEVLQLTSPLGQVDIIFACRPLSKAMLSRKNLMKIVGIPCIEAEDIIGLKIQAVANNPRRKLRDFADIQSLAETNTDLDLKRIREYAELFDMWKEVEALVTNNKQEGQ